MLNIYGEMAHAPAVVNAYHAMRRALADDGTLDARTREAIALAVNAVDRCDYCQAAHTLAALRAGISDEQALQLRSGDVDFDDRLAALLAVVREVAGHLGYVEEPTWHAALRAGWSDEQLTEAFGYVIATMFTNYFNHKVGTELDIPEAPALLPEPLAGR